ncbi:hypothetical protein [Kitasatospora terrestris]|uniref:Guanylate cyclase domain-containing protein n=1 Tax=Kitasatospora terrestris TaxID=258051 RepID=A0ABP9DUJ6_9ACTN
MPPAAPPHLWDIPPEQTLFVVDIKDFSKVQEHRQPRLRLAMDRAVEAAFVRSGLATEWDITARHDRGDGFIMVLPPARTWRLVDPLIRLLDDELRSHEEHRAKDDPPLRVRVSVHVGPMPTSNLADAVNDAARFVDSDAARVGIAAAAAHGSYAALVLSDDMYRRTVLAGRSKLLPDSDFLPWQAAVTGKAFRRQAWIHVPRLSPAVIAQFLPQPDVPRTQDPGPQEAPPSSIAPRGIQVSGNVSINTMADRIENLRTHQINHAPQSIGADTGIRRLPQPGGQHLP